MISSRIFIFVLLLHPLLFTISTSIELTCTFKTNTDWWAIDNVYFCEQDLDIDISRGNSEITAISGIHEKGRSNSDIEGFRIDKKQMRLFPQKINDYVGNLVFIAIWETGLREIHQRDLKPFTAIKILSFFGNELEVLERNLLKFNTNLEYIGLGRNKIRTVDGKIFNHLRNLHSLHFDSNVCMSRQVGGNKNEVWDLVEEIEEKC